MRTPPLFSFSGTAKTTGRIAQERVLDQSLPPMGLFVTYILPPVIVSIDRTGGAVDGGHLWLFLCAFWYAGEEGHYGNRRHLVYP